MTFKEEVQELVSQIDESIRYMTIVAERQGISVYELKHMDGTFAMERLLLAKSHALQTLAYLQGPQRITISKEDLETNRVSLLDEIHEGLRRGIVHD